MDLDYEESGLWSPPVQRSAFLSSPGHVCTDEEMEAKLKAVTEALHRRSKVVLLETFDLVKVMFCWNWNWNWN
ncbi:hypothetical protein CKAN_01824800 [Cinnamomum micranthum f. kanehirae]|uniref:Uncharacterized protein n=1 Tax=Cinnamomum micranthum f. kanehirae TaxID=337451 RepID=A0A3S3NK35_9MAGN|nr:hypothetical protein CKAN_01824800 [Cinnamomum micranthum f. kanehirae]